VVNMKDVAELAGVSVATVSRVLTNKPYITQDVRERVNKAVENLGYRPNRIARNLRIQQSKSIGLVLSDLSNNPFFNHISQAIEEMAYKEGYAVLLFNSAENPDKEAICLEVLRDERVSGVIIAPTSETANSVIPTIDLDTPMVVINRKIQSSLFDSVLLDNFDSAYLLASHLVQDGYNRFGCLFSSRNSSVRARQAGFTQALHDYGLPLVPELCLSSDTTEEEGYRGTTRLMDLPTPPDVIFATNGSLATGSFRLLRDRGIAIPDQLGFACFDDFPWMSLVRPQITVIQQPVYDIGRTAIEMLFNRIAHPGSQSRDVLLHGNLLIRDSCNHHNCHNCRGNFMSCNSR